MVCVATGLDQASGVLLRRLPTMAVFES